MSSQPYLSVNVYPFADGWQVVAMVKTPGRPYPRLLRPIGTWPLPSDTRSLPEALLAAAKALEQAAADIEPHLSAQR